jgi:predicted 3-demethylubiquinone-9 3-methyltransferase (glyoxalase superfamily)
MNKATPFLMFNDQLEAAIEFYTATFPNSEAPRRAGLEQPPVDIQKSGGGRRGAARG